MDRVRLALEQLYEDTCSIYIKEPVKTGAITRHEDVVKYQDQPCRISFKSIEAAGEGESSSVKVVHKLFISPDLEIPSGCRIDVTRNGRTTSYHHSGEVALYKSHQEIMLETLKEYA